MTAIPLRRDVHYPESDGKPMGETEIHIREIIYLLQALDEHLREAPDVYVGADMFLYYLEGVPKAVVVPRRLRRPRRLPGRAPDLQALGRGATPLPGRRGHLGQHPG